MKTKIILFIILSFSGHGHGAESFKTIKPLIGPEKHIEKIPESPETPAPTPPATPPQANGNTNSGNGKKPESDGWCTDGVKKIKGPLPWNGNAKDWLANAKAKGIETGTEPRPGAIVVFGSWGHVGVLPNTGTGSLIDMNGGKNCGTITDGKCSNTFGKFSESAISSIKMPVVGYIYYKPEKVCPTSGVWSGTSLTCGVDDLRLAESGGTI